jgi:MraZ protein
VGKHVLHPILSGEHELTLDAKNRLLVPSEVRKSLNPERDGEAFFLVVGRNRKPWLYTERYYEHLVESGQEQHELTPDEDLLAFDQFYFAMASRIELDAQGRLLLPEKVLRRTKTGKEVTLIGVRNHLEIWNRADWDNQFDQHLARYNELVMKAKQARKPQP